MHKGRGYLRDVREQHIKRKERIVKETGSWWYKHRGSLAKGKIHCSCPLCRRKSYDDPRISDLKMGENFREQLDEYFSQDMDE